MTNERRHSRRGGAFRQKEEASAGEAVSKRRMLPTEQGLSTEE